MGSLDILQLCEHVLYGLGDEPVLGVVGEEEVVGVAQGVLVPEVVVLPVRAEHRVGLARTGLPVCKNSRVEAFCHVFNAV